MDTTRRGFLASTAAATGAAVTQDLAHAADDGHDHQAVPSDPALRVKSLESLLVEKGLVDSAALDAMVDLYEHKIGPRNGARVVAKAWIDPAYRRRLLADPDRAIAELGYTGLQGEHMMVVENTPRVHNLVVYTFPRRSRPGNQRKARRNRPSRSPRPTCRGGSPRERRRDGTRVARPCSRWESTFARATSIRSPTRDCRVMCGANPAPSIVATGSLFFRTPPPIPRARSRSTCIPFGSPRAICGANRPHREMPFISISVRTILSRSDPAVPAQRLAALPRLPRDDSPSRSSCPSKGISPGRNGPPRSPMN
jgi:Nitrile hydratase, alpha chain